MDCWPEETLEAAAIRMVEAGVTTTTPVRGIVPEDLIPLLDHVQGCVRCREVLVILLETEARLKGRLLKLQPLPLARADRVRESRPDGVLDESYALAAMSSEKSQSDSLDQTRVLTLATMDERYLVRVFPNELGSGATAVLIRFRALEEASPTAENPHVVLQIDGTEYPFDEKGVAVLPAFPTAEIHLALR